MSSPLISICLPNLNYRRFLDERMETILAQTMKDWELIICDSYSADGSWEFFQKFKGDPRIRMYQVPREGIYAGWNECLRRATGEYIYIATSDDTMSPACLEQLVAPLQRNRQLAVAVCNFERIDEEGRPIPQEISPKYSAEAVYGEWMNTPSIRDGKTEFLLHAVFGTVWATMTAVLFRRNLLGRTGHFRTDQGSLADNEWSLRAALASDIAFVPGKLATFRKHAKQASPHSLPRDFTRRFAEQVSTVLHDPNAGVPAAWREVAGWDCEITAVWRMEYLSRLNLFRGVARREPLKFLRNIGYAALHEPGFLLRQIGTGFGWSDAFSPDPVATARRLLNLFQASWPPVRWNEA